MELHLLRSLCFVGVFALLYHSALIVEFPEALLSVAVSFPIFLIFIFLCLLRTKASSYFLPVCREVAKGMLMPTLIHSLPKSVGICVSRGNTSSKV